eukprot:sb/3476481/
MVQGAHKKLLVPVPRPRAESPHKKLTNPHVLDWEEEEEEDGTQEEGQDGEENMEVAVPVSNQNHETLISPPPLHRSSPDIPDNTPSSWPQQPVLKKSVLEQGKPFNAFIQLKSKIS